MAIQNSLGQARQFSRARFCQLNTTVPIAAHRNYPEGKRSAKRSNLNALAHIRERQRLQVPTMTPSYTMHHDQFHGLQLILCAHTLTVHLGRKDSR